MTVVAFTFAAAFAGLFTWSYVMRRASDDSSVPSEEYIAPICKGRMVVFAGSNESDPEGTVIYNRVRNKTWMCNSVSRCPCELQTLHANGGSFEQIHCKYCNDRCLNALTVGHRGGYQEWHDSRAVWLGPIECPIPQYCSAPYGQRGVLYKCS